MAKLSKSSWRGVFRRSAQPDGDTAGSPGSSASSSRSSSLAPPATSRRSSPDKEEEEEGQPVASLPDAVPPAATVSGPSSPPEAQHPSEEQSPPSRPPPAIPTVEAAPTSDSSTSSATPLPPSSPPPSPPSPPLPAKPRPIISFITGPNGQLIEVKPSPTSAAQTADHDPEPSPQHDPISTTTHGVGPHQLYKHGLILRGWKRWVCCQRNCRCETHWESNVCSNLQCCHERCGGCGVIQA